MRGLISIGCAEATVARKAGTAARGLVTGSGEIVTPVRAAVRDIRGFAMPVHAAVRAKRGFVMVARTDVTVNRATVRASASLSRSSATLADASF